MRTIPSSSLYPAQRAAHVEKAGDQAINHYRTISKSIQRIHREMNKKQPSF